jgi:hypothetical protein
MRTAVCLGIAILACLSSACIVQGGEEKDRETESHWVGIVRFEAINQDGEIVGSGCTVDAPRYHDQIRFSAAAGDRVELTERFEMVPATVASAEAHADDAGFWCSQTDTYPYHEVFDVSCWKAVPPRDSEACYLEGGVVGLIEGTAFVPPASQPIAGKTEGFTLSIVVSDVGKQCVQMRCNDTGPRREQLAFVVE